MILYTPVPMDMVFPVRQPEPVTLERDGRYFTGIRSGSGVRITRLCSTCPADYLRADWQPGCILPEQADQSYKGTGPGPGSGPDDRSVRQRL